MSTDEFHSRRTLPGCIDSLGDASLPTAVPKQIGPYKIECLLEMGGMSILYLGIHPNSGDVTTIKVLSPKYLSHPDVVQRFLREAEIIAMTDHPNIVKLYGHGQWEGGLYIAMEFIQGISLRQMLLQRPISLKRALEITIDIAYALCHLHTHGVIHRDLKPENVLITDSGEVKVIDFGIAQLLTERVPGGGPPVQKVIGTPIYMSPEQRENPETVSYPSDIYSLGIIAYELVLGKLSHGMIHLALMPKGLQKILAKALQPDLKNRYSDIVDFITDVSSYLNSTNLDKEKKPGDQLSEISEDLSNIHELLISSVDPDWPDIAVSSGCVRSMNIFGVYDDFFAFPDGTYGVVMGESQAEGAEGVIFTAMLRGMVHSCVQQTHKPVELVSMLNKLVAGDKRAGTFTFGYLLLNPKAQHFEYISCGETNLWMVSPNRSPEKIVAINPLLGRDLKSTFSGRVVSWNRGDGIIFCSLISDLAKDSVREFFDKALGEIEGQFAPKKFVEAILRKTKLSMSKILPKEPLTLIGLLWN